MFVLIAVASRHQATTGIAAAVADELYRAGHAVDLRPVEEVADLDGVDAVVLGSAIYMGRWLQGARDFAERHRDELACRPLWLFSSGPLGDESKPMIDPEQLVDALSGLAVRDHQLFAGRLDRADLGLGERLVVGMVRAPEGDYRDWDAIRAWAGEVAAALDGSTVPAAAR
jgi:menaquinone-dependent protoporphyrinogen oxidase